MEILSVRGALPPHHYTQQQITDAFVDVIASGGLDERLLRRFHGNAGVESRHAAVIAYLNGTQPFPTPVEANQSMDQVLAAVQPLIS